MDSRIWDAITRNVWALESSTFEKLSAIVQRHAEGIRLSAGEIEAVVATRKKTNVGRGYEVDGQTAIIPIRGVIHRHAGGIEDISGPSGTSVDAVRASLEAALEAPDVRNILLHIDSPGGGVEGIEELAQDIYDARGKKRVYALADGSMASAALWLGVQAERVMATRGSRVGSIGVVANIVDTKKGDAARGVETKTITSAAFKAGSPVDAKLTTDEVRNIADQIDDFHSLFVEAVARGRGVALEQAAAWGDGRVHMGAKAKSLGLIDEVASYQQALAAINEEAAMTASVRAEDDEKDMEKEDAKAAATESTTVSVTTTSETESPDKEDEGEDEADEAKAAAPAPAVSARTVDSLILEARAQARIEERARVSAIRAAALPGQDALVAQLIDNGATEIEALRAINADMRARKDSLLSARRAVQPDVEQPEPIQVVTAERTAEQIKATSDKQLKAQWDKDASLRAEFLNDFNTFAAYSNGVAEGTIRTRKNR